MENFTFHRPGSLAEAQEQLRAAEGGKFMAGGQSLIPILKLELAAPSVVISLSGIAELMGIRLEDGALVVGAGTTHAEVAESTEVRESIPALAELAGQIGDPQVRNRGTLGGSVAHADPAADYPAALVALGATVVTDRREIDAEDFFEGMFETPLEEDEIITGVRFPIPEAAAYAKFPNPASRYAIAGVFVARGSGGVRVAVTGPAGGVFRASGFEEALAGDFSAGALDGLAVASEGMLSDPDAGAEYRAHLVGVMAKRAVEACS
jgi:aerobic carbon-monoxide dehydrogenase medium subunit